MRWRPGLAIFLVVMGFNLLGDGLRDVLDPRIRRAAPMTASLCSRCENLRVSFATERGRRAACSTAST